MKNSVSDESFYIESEEEDNAEKGFHDRDGEDDDNGTHSDSSDDESAHRNSYSTAWPQSYRQSIDLFTNVPSPSIGFLGGSPLSRFSSSFLSLTLTRRHTPESLAAVTKPLIQTEADEETPKHRRSSHESLLRVPSRSHETPMSHNSSYWQAVLNGINVLCGVGMLSTPYAVKEGGWFGLVILFTYGLLSFYTGMLLRYCLDSKSELETYPDIGQAAFGTTGRIIVSIILYVELYANCVEYLIVEIDNLSYLFPNASLTFGEFELKAHHLFALVTTLSILPTVYLRDLSILSYVSAGGVIASGVVVLCLFWCGLVDEVGVHSKGTSINLATLPVAIGLYGFCYSGHGVFPNIYTSMAKPSQYTAVLFTCFGICTLMYAGVAVMGYTMLGEATESQFTLNMPPHLISSKIAVWTTVINPFTNTYALTLSPVAMSLEELLPSKHTKSYWYAIGIRTVLVFSTLLVGLAVPFFGLVMSLIGSLLTMLIALVLPPACYLSILWTKVTRPRIALCVLVILVGTVSSVVGTYSSLTKIIQQLST